MARIGFEATIEVTVRGPLLVTSSAIGPWGVDALCMRSPDGRLVISGDAMQAKVREAFDELGGDPFRRSRAEDMKTAVVKGSATERENSYQKNLDAAATRYPAFFSDFLSLATWPGPGEQTIAMTAMDSTAGAAKEGSLRVLDAPLLPGQPAVFQGQVRFFADNASDGDRKLQSIKAALDWVISLGSQKSVGFGRNVNATSKSDVRVVPPTITDFSERSTPIKPVSLASYLADFTFRDALCLPEGVANGNIFESRDEIPGEVLRGALAELLNQIHGQPSGADLAGANPSSKHPFSTLCHHFDRLRITTARLTKPDHAEPAPVIPLSLAFADGGLIDCALESEDEILKKCVDGPIAFAHDWKDDQSNLVRERSGVILPKQELRVRTAIESDSRRAREHSLFAYRVIRPEGLVWRGTISVDTRDRAASCLSEAAAEQVLAECFALLDLGWLSVSKTRARGRAVSVRSLSEANDRGLSVVPTDKGTEKYFAIKLRGHTLMIDPRECLEANNENGAMKCPEEIDQLYQGYWNKASGGLLEEVPSQRFKVDSLVGGFQARRYRYAPDTSLDLNPNSPVADRIAGQKLFPYNPTLVVDPGSVFVLRLSDASQLAQAQDVIRDWLRNGLPLPDWAKRAYGETYHTNIFLPENGFGEIEVHHSDGWSPATSTAATDLSEVAAAINVPEGVQP